MTTIEAPPRPADSVDKAPAPRPGSARSRVVRAWPIALRLARREVQRRPGRTILVMLLVVLPVCAMTAGSVLVRSDTSAAFFANGFANGTSITATPGFEEGQGVDNSLTIFHPGVSVAVADEPVVPRDPFSDEQVAALREAFDGRAEVVHTTRVYTDVASSSATEFLELAQWPLQVSDQTVDDVFAFDSGRPPASANEVLLSRNIAEAFDVEVGDQLVLTIPERSWEVVGIMRDRASYSNRLAFVGALDRADIVPDALDDLVIVKPFGEPTRSELVALKDEVALTLDTDSTFVNDESILYGHFEDDQVKSLAWGWVGGVVSLIAVGVVISAAFATSARRQMATVGQLSANGAPVKVIERSLALQGSWTGALGAMLGIGLGLLAVFAAWPMFEELVGYELPDRSVSVFDLAIIAATATMAATVAALLPAKSAARVPVLTALAGRRPVGAIPRWFVPVGVLAMAGGLGLLTLVTIASQRDGGGDLASLVSVVGAVSVMGGLICISPVLIEAAGRIGHRWPGSVLLAVRSLVRQRTRSAAVVSAIAVVMALTTAGLTGLGVAQAESEANTVANRTIKAQPHGPLTDGEISFEPIPQTLVDEVAALVPNAERIDVPAVPIDVPGFAPDGYQITATVATNEVLPLLGLSDAAVANLRASGIASAGSVGEFGVAEDLGGMAMIGWDDVGDGVVWFDFLVTPEWVAERSLDTFTAQVVWVNDTALTAGQRDGANSIASGGRAVGFAFMSVLDEAGFETSPDARIAAGWSAFHTARGDVGFPWDTVKLAALGTALALVLGVVSIGLGLAAVESRDERSVLHVVGAPPAVLRWVAAAKAWVLTSSAALVAVPVGFVVVWAIRAASRGEFGAHAGVPWLAVSSLTILVPALAAAGAWLGSTVAQRFSPVTASRMRLD